MAKNNRFTDQPQMEDAEARYDDQYWKGHGDCKAGKSRNEIGTSSYHKGYSDAFKEMKQTEAGPNKKDQ